MRSRANFLSILLLSFFGALAIRCSTLPRVEEPTIYHGVTLLSSTGMPAAGVKIQALTLWRRHWFQLLSATKVIGSALSNDDGKFTIITTGGQARYFSAHFCSFFCYSAKLERHRLRSEEPLVLELTPAYSITYSGCGIPRDSGIERVAKSFPNSVIQFFDKNGNFLSVRQYLELHVISEESFELLAKYQAILGGCSEKNSRYPKDPCRPCILIHSNGKQLVYDDVNSPIRWLPVG